MLFLFPAQGVSRSSSGGWLGFWHGWMSAGCLWFPGSFASTSAMPGLVSVSGTALREAGREGSVLLGQAQALLGKGIFM